MVVPLPSFLFAVTPALLRRGPGGMLRQVHAANPAVRVVDSLRHVAYGAPGNVTAVLLMLPIGVALYVTGLLEGRVARTYVVEHPVD